jgi:hypothetical protein
MEPKFEKKEKKKGKISIFIMCFNSCSLGILEAKTQFQIKVNQRF